MFILSYSTKKHLSYCQPCVVLYPLSTLHSLGPGGGGVGVLPHETDGDACRLAKGFKIWIVVSIRVFRAKRQYVMPPRSRLGFREETKNNAMINRNQIFFLTCFVDIITSVI